MNIIEIVVIIGDTIGGLIILHTKAIIKFKKMITIMKLQTVLKHILKILTQKYSEKYVRYLEYDLTIIIELFRTKLLYQT